MATKIYKKLSISILAMTLLIGMMTQFTLPAAAAGPSILQVLIDTTPEGRTLTLTADMVGKIHSLSSEEVTINKAITIKGPSSNNPVQLDWIRLIITSDNVTLKNLRFTKGDTNYKGMFIYNQGGNNLTFENCAFDTEHNRDIDGLREAISGGSVYLNNSKNIVFKNCVFRYNKSTANGGSVSLENVENCSFEGCTFEKNRGIDNGSVLGGGSTKGGSIFAKNSKLISLTNCTFSGNYAEQYGAAAYFSSCNSVDISNCVFMQNDCTPVYAAVYEVYGMGGALAFRNAHESTISNCSFIGNKAYSGGGVFVAKSSLIVNDCNFAGNIVENKVIVNPDLLRSIIENIYAVYTLDIQGLLEKFTAYALTEVACPEVLIDDFTKGTGKIGGEGGGIYAINSKFTVMNGNFNGNDAEKSGGGIYVAGDNNAKDTQIKGCIFRNNKAKGSGGAITNLMTGSVIENCLIQNNYAEAGGGIYSVASYDVIDSDFVSNSAKVGGAACSNLIGNHQTYTNCFFDSNTATAGAAVFNHGAVAEDELASVESEGNIAAVHLLTVKGCEFKQNYSTVYGGAIYTSYANNELLQCSFTQNEAEKGGAFCLNSPTVSDTVPGRVVKINKCQFQHNKAENGGAIYNISNSKIITNKTKYQDNLANFSGGVIYDNNGDIRVENSLFTGNRTGLMTAGGVFYLNGTKECSITNCTIANNYPNVNYTYNGMSAIYAKNGAELKLRNNIIVSNTVIENVSARDVIVSKDSIIDAKYNLCGLKGTGNVNGTVSVFADGGVGTDYHLRYDFSRDSLGDAMEAGKNNAVSQRRDLDDNKRILDNDGDGVARVDLGCYEQQYIQITFNIDSAAGEISGDTIQWIERGSFADLSAVTVATAKGWEFDHWETAEGTLINEETPLKSGQTVIAMCKEVTSE